MRLLVYNREAKVRSTAVPDRNPLGPLTAMRVSAAMTVDEKAVAVAAQAQLSYDEAG